MNRAGQRLLLSVGCLFATMQSAQVMAQSGHVLDAVGPVNQSMGGAGTAMPLDAMGALHWNPASAVGLPSSELGFGMQVFAPQSELSSRVSADAFGPGAPATAQSGQTDSDIDPSPIPSLAFVCQRPDSRWVYGVSAFGIGGFGVDYAASTANPITTPQPPSGFGFGPIQSEFQMLQVTLTTAYRLTDDLSIGFGVDSDWATLAVSPFAAASPDDANLDGFPTRPDGSRGDSAWGMGFRAGVYYEHPHNGWHLGASVKSPQWMQTFQINSQDEAGAHRSLEFDLDYPMIASLGAGYSGLDRWKFAADLRYIDYENTDGFQSAGYDATGAVTGFGWESIWVVAAGMEYRATDCLALRCGYSFNTSPVSDANVAAPAIVQHHLSAGFSYDTTDNWTVSVAASHGFANSISGPWQSPSGPIAGTSASSRLSTSSVTFGVAKKF